MDSEDTLCILSCERGCRRHCIATMGSKNFLVGLKTPVDYYLGCGQEVQIHL